MKKLYILLCVSLLLTACALSPKSNEEKFREAMEKQFTQETFHIKESVETTIDGIVSAEQNKELYYSKGNFYAEDIQSNNTFRYGIYHNNNGYTALSKSQQDIKWTKITSESDLEMFRPWFLNLDVKSHFSSDENIQVTEEESEIVVIYRRTDEGTSQGGALNANAETYYFDKSWKLIKMELLAEGTYENESGQNSTMRMLVTTYFQDTSKKTIVNKIEDTIKTIK